MEVYRPGLWIILRDLMAPQKQSLGEIALEHVRVIIDTLVQRLGLT